MYLFTQDYKRVIQLAELNQITSNDIAVRQIVEGSVQAEITAYLIQRYDLPKEFQDTNAWSYSLPYKATNRFFLDAPAYNSTNTYALHTLTLQAGNVYICTTAIGTPEAFNPAHWTLLNVQYSLYNAILPQPAFDQEAVYKKGDKVFYIDAVYTAIQDSMEVDHDGSLNAIEYKNMNNINQFPDDLNQTMWSTATPYSIAAGTLPTNTTYYAFGDNRNQMLINMYLDMVVYELCKRIAPANLPEARHNAWLRAIENLKKFAKEDITAALPIVQDKKKQGSDIRSGGTVKFYNQW